MGPAADEYFVPEFKLDYKVKKKLLIHGVFFAYFSFSFR